MKILILTPDIFTKGGIARYTATFASALGHLIGPDNIHVLALLRFGESEGSPAKYRILSPGVSRLTIASKLRFAGMVLGNGFQKYNLLVCTHIGLSPVAGLMSLFFGIPFWVVCHGREAWSRLSADVRWALGRADMVLPVSRYTAKTLSGVTGISLEKMRVVYNAIPDELAGMLMASNGTKPSGPTSDRKEQRILSVGTVTKGKAYKGYDTVIRALSKVRQALPNARYLIVGEGDDIDRLKRVAAETGVGNFVNFKGEITDAELAEYYRACDVFALPSRTTRHDGGWTGEGFGRVYVEAALAGKPVVGSCGGGAPEAVLHGQTGLLVDPASDPEVADALITLLQQREMAAKMGAQGRKWALENFTSAALNRQLSQLLTGYGF